MSPSERIFSILRVDPLNEHTCCGLRRDGLSCGNRVAIASRQSAYRTLLQCTDLPSSSLRLHENFKAAATLLLCKRWHQNQWSAVVDSWLGALEAYQDSTDSGYGSEPGSEEEGVLNERSLYPPRPLLERLPGQRSIRSTRADSDISPYENVMITVLSSNLSPGDKLFFLQNFTSTNRRIDSREGSRTSRDRSSSSNTTITNSSSSSSSNRSSGTSSHRNIERSTPPVTQRSTPSPMPNMSNRNRSSGNSSNSTNDRSEPFIPTPSPPSRRSDRSISRTTSTTPPPRPPFRASHLECSICLESYNGRRDDFWECQNCKNRVHSACHRLWSTASRTPRSLDLNPSVKCVYCRAVVAPS